MEGEIEERWYELCEQAAEEKGPQKLLSLARKSTACFKRKKRALGSHKQLSTAK